MDEDDIESVKVALLGSAGVGKTCIIVRFVNDSYSDNSASTDGVSYSQKFIKVNDKQVRLDIWDTSGQEQYRSLGKHFYKDAYIVGLVYDITRNDSFEELKNVWYKDLKLYGEKYTTLAVVGSKSDCYEQEKVSESKAREFAKEIGAIFQLTSSKENNGITELFENLVKAYLDPEFSAKIKEIKKEKGSTTKLKTNAQTGKNNEGKGCCSK